MNKPWAVFPGSFDPYTTAHRELVLNASKFFNVCILIAVNPNKGAGMFTPEERKEIIMKTIGDDEHDNIKVDITDRLVSEYCWDNDINYIIRGIRYNNAAEELDLAHIYFEDNMIKTIFIPTYNRDNEHVSSTRVREYIKRNNMTAAFGMIPRESRPYIQSLTKNNK